LLRFLARDAGKAATPLALTWGRFSAKNILFVGVEWERKAGLQRALSPVDSDEAATPDSTRSI
jgi:hypothetical protein